MDLTDHRLNQLQDGDDYIQNEKVYNLNMPVATLIRSRGMRWEGLAERMEETRNAHKNFSWKARHEETTSQTLPQTRA
jgi:hypothetical protein